MRLYEIDQQVEAFEQELLDVEGELTSEMEVRWQHLISTREDKWRSYVAVVRQCEAEAKIYKEEAERLKVKHGTATKRVEWLKGQLMLSLEQSGLQEVKTEIGKIKIMSASQAPLLLKPGVQIDELPDQFKKVTIEENRIALREALQAGDNVAARYADFGERTRYVRIF